MVEIFFLSPASGTQIKVVSELRYPYILINFMTKNSKYVPSAEILFVDSGGFPSSFLYNGYNRTDLEYLHFVRKTKANLFALRDYPCEPQILQKYNVTAKDQIHRTLEHHIKLLELSERLEVKAKPIPVIQGWELEDYYYCIDLFREHGLITDYMAIGSLCRRNATKQIQQIIIKVRQELPAWVKLHAFGVKLSALKNIVVWRALHSCDSSAWDFWARFEKRPLDTFEKSLETCRKYLEKIECLRRFFECQQTLDVEQV